MIICKKPVKLKRITVKLTNGYLKD